MADDGSTPADDAVEQALSVVFPDGLPPRARGASDSPIVRTFPLTAEHINSLAENYESGEAMGVPGAYGHNGGQGLRTVKRRHHRLAMLLAAGTMTESQAALACGLHPATVSLLKQDPLFHELLTLYSDGVTAEFQDAVSQMADLADDMIGRLRDIMDNSPEQLSVDQILKALPILTDRTGNGPTSNVNTRSIALNLNSRDLADAKADAARRVVRPLRAIGEDHRRALNSLDPAGGQSVRAEAGEEGLAPGRGPSLRAQGPDVAIDALFRDEPDSDGENQ